MKKWITILATICSFHLFAQQDIKLEEAKFKTGDNSNWKELSFDDSQWGNIKSSVNWEFQGYPDYNGYAWYRFHFKLPSSIKDKSLWKDSLRIALDKIDDDDEAYLNGVLIGKTQGWNIFREYHIAANNPAILWNADNVIAIRVLDTGGGGGMYGKDQHISMMDIIDGISMKLQFNKTEAVIVIHNSVSKKIEGKLIVSVTDPETNKASENIIKQVSVKPGENFLLKTANDVSKRLLITANFEESLTHKTIQISQSTPYILTPAPSAFPKINGATVFGVRPGSPVLYKIAATGERPLHYAVENLPEGLKVDAATGIIAGAIKMPGTYTMKLKVKNSKGIAARTFKIKVGDILALTPPMGWNSWNCWGLSVSTEKVESSAKALIDKGLIDHGWSFINIDDGWEEPTRDADGNVISNSKFPDMKALSDWLHSNGLKFGIYSSPGPKTCGGYLGSYQHEINDATTYAKWGVDYLKYDWCSYENIAGKDTSMATYQKPYAIMRDALLKQNRDIVFSLCQYGMKKVWEWGDKVNGNCWRTTGDIEDTWESLKNIGFSQTVQHKYTKPGRWSDPDMLIVGQVGWGENLHPTRLTPDEQYTHISLWSLLSAPLLIGCDISKLDDFTLNLLSNDEVIAVNQDALGHEAKQVLKKDTYQVWIKELEDGSHAVGIFNLSDNYQTIQINFNDIELKKANAKKVRDLWRQKYLGIYKNLFGTKVAPHGVTLIKVID